MSSIEKLSIALPAEMADAIRDAVDAGDYASNSEVVREALRDWSHKRTLREQSLESVRRLWNESISDKREFDPEVVFTRLEKKYARMAAKASLR